MASWQRVLQPFKAIDFRVEAAQACKVEVLAIRCGGEVAVPGGAIPSLSAAEPAKATEGAGGRALGGGGPVAFQGGDFGTLGGDSPSDVIRIEAERGG